MSPNPLSPNAVCVFCASSAQVAPEIFRDGKESARLLAKEGYSLVYGGTTCGLMKAVADASMEAGGHVIGVVPGFMVEKGIAHPELHEIVQADTMADRKTLMNQRSGAFLVLPGGVGTMDELFDTFAQKQLGMHTKPIILLNTLGYYRHLREFFADAVQHATMKPEHLSLISFAETPQEVLEILRKYVPPNVPGKIA